MNCQAWGPCPRCGYCPACGRGGVTPYQPLQPVPFPWIPDIVTPYQSTPIWEYQPPYQTTNVPFTSIDNITSIN